MQDSEDHEHDDRDQRHDHGDGHKHGDGDGDGEYEHEEHKHGEHDAAIIEQSLSTPERFTAIFDRHAAYVQRYIARRLGPQVADDLIAETFLVAFDKRARYDLTRPDARP